MKTKKMRKDIRILILILILVIFMGACTSPPEPQPDQTLTTPTSSPLKANSEDGLFSKAEEMYRIRAYIKALELYNDYLSKFPDGKFAPSALMREGEIYTALGDHSIARNVYKYLIDRYSGSPLVPDAHIKILETYYKEESYKSVIRYGENILKNINSMNISSKGEYIFRINLLIGDSYMSLGSPINAAYFYTLALRERQPPHLSRERYRDNTEIVKKLKNAVASLSSADIDALLKRYPANESSWVNGYLMYRLGQSYLNEGKNEDAARVLSEFIQKFPDHEEVQQAKEVLAKFEQAPLYNNSAIGCLLPLSGPYKLYGNKALKGVQLALNQAISWGGKPALNIIIKDTGSDPNRAVLAVRELANERVSAIIGPIITAEAAAQEAQKRKIPMITLTQKEGITEIGDYVFRNFITPKMQVEAIVSYAVKRLGLTNFAILYPDEKYGTTFMELFHNEVLSYGGTIVGAESYSPAHSDFGQPIRRLKQYAFDAIFIPDAPKKVGLIIPQLAYYNVTRVQLLGTNLWHSDILIQMAQRHANGAIIPEGFFAESYRYDVRDFTKAFQENFNEKPEFIEAIAYDTAKILFQTLDRVDPRFGNTMKDELTQLYNFQGITGLTSFDEAGEAHKKLYLLRVKRGKFVEVEE